MLKDIKLATRGRTHGGHHFRRNRLSVITWNHSFYELSQKSRRDNAPNILIVTSHVCFVFLTPLFKHILCSACRCVFGISLFSLPFAIWHFASISLWGVISNMLAIPLTGMVIMPAGVVMLVSLMLGLPAFGGKIMELSLGLLIEITRFFAALPGSAVYLYPPEQMLLLVWIISIVAIMSVRGFARAL